MNQFFWLTTAALVSSRGQAQYLEIRSIFYPILLSLFHPERQEENRNSSKYLQCIWSIKARWSVLPWVYLPLRPVSKDSESVSLTMTWHCCRKTNKQTNKLWVSELIGGPPVCLRFCIVKSDDQIKTLVLKLYSWEVLVFHAESTCFSLPLMQPLLVCQGKKYMDRTFAILSFLL